MPEARLYICIKQGTKNPFVPVVQSGNKKLKAHYALVAGKQEYHPEGAYYLRDQRAGKRVWELVGSDPTVALVALRRRNLLIEADDIDLQVAVEPVASTHVVPPPAEKLVEGNSLRKAAATYIADVRKSKANRTYLVYKHTLDSFLEACKARTVEGITRDDVIAYIEKRSAEANTKRTISNHVMHLRSFCNFFGVKLPLLKTDRSRYKYTEKWVEAYSKQELATLFAHADREETGLFQFLLCTGARDQEAQNASWADIDFNRKRFRIKETGVSCNTRHDSKRNPRAGTQ